MAALALGIVAAPAAPASAYQAGLCAVPVTTDSFDTCSSGDANSKIRVALIGDSHTRSWFGPTSQLAQKYGWSLTVISKSACPPMDPTKMPGHLPSQTCVHWNQQLQDYLNTQPAFNLVINMSSSFVTQGQADFGKAFAVMAARITATGARLLVIHDNPKPIKGFLGCISSHPTDAASACAKQRAQALQPADPMGAAAAKVPGVKLVDFTNSFCGPKTCSPVIDGITVYRDHSHISADWAMHLLPQLEAAIPSQFKK